MLKERIKGTRITVDLENEVFYRTIKTVAAFKGQALREIVSEALKDWLLKQEDLEDLKDFIAVEDEPSRSFQEFVESLEKKKH